MLSFLYVYSDHSILECYNLFSGVELSMRSFFVIIIGCGRRLMAIPEDCAIKEEKESDVELLTRRHNTYISYCCSAISGTDGEMTMF